MRVEARSISGEKLIFVQLEPQLAMAAWYHLSLAQVDPLGTIGSRTLVAPLVSSLGRALVACGYIDQDTLNDFAKHLREKPSDALDQHAAIRALGSLGDIKEASRG
jgi:hypothetical protein